MAFQGQMSSSEFLIDDSNFHNLVPDQTVDGEVKGRGLFLRPADKPHGSMPFAAPFSLPVIPRSAWPDMIADMERNKSRLSDVREDIVSLDQNGTNFCWGHGPTTAITLVRKLNNQPYIRFSATSICSMIKGYRNVGGWGGEALEWIVEKGICDVKFWPANKINRQYETAEMKADALNNRVTEWYDLQPRNFDQLMTCLLLRIPVAIGLNWWSHEVCAIDPVMPSQGKFGARIWNSWTDSWSERGMAVLAESKATPDDAVAPRVINANQAA